MILSVDVHYRNTEASIAGLAFQHWEDEQESGSFQSTLQNIDAYLPGQFFRRELPCILKLLEEHKLSPDTIVIDGFVTLGAKHEPGLGKYLYEALNRKVTVVGVAKMPFKGIPAECELLRGRSRRPLYITSAGLSLPSAKALIKSMHGSFRIPTLLKKTDQLSRRTS